ncbi:MAG: ribosomal protein S18-alanine N-acetyltransferase [Clostridia bacterium]
MEIHISKMTLEDLNIIKDCLLEEFDDFWSYNVLKQELENNQNLNSQYFVAKLKEEVVGFVGILTIIDEVNIMNIVVRKNSRNLGIGSLLIENVINFSKQQKASLITLEVNENNLPAINLYKKYNFKQVGLRKKYYNNTNNAILMSLELNQGGKNK